MEKYQKVKPNGSFTDQAVIANKVYHVLFTGLHALHVCQNYKKDPLHNLTHPEIVTYFKRSLLVKLGDNKFVSLYKHKNKVYETYVKFEGNAVLVKTAYQSNKRHFIELYNILNDN